jgi:hypothetical protein
MCEYVSWPADLLDPHRLAAQAQVIRVVAMVAAKAGERRIDHEAAKRFRQEMARSGAACDEAQHPYGENPARRGGWRRNIGSPPKPRLIFPGSQPRMDFGERHDVDSFRSSRFSAGF